MATDFVVAGVGDFPFDMLRYDECWPQDQAAVAAMLAPNPRRQVALRTDKKPFFAVTQKRWESFNWQVVSIDGEPADHVGMSAR